nr:extracellular solute-binding protein [Mycoplana sp. BE70]
MCLLTGTASAHAEGELNIYNWGNYTSPDLVKKFEETYSVKVTVTDYDSSDTALAKVRQGGHGFDLVMVSSSSVSVWIKEGLVLETRPDQMENFKNMDPKWVDVPFDSGRHYSIPWQWGTTGVSVNTSLYSGDPNTSAIFLNPPAELVGKINVVPEMNDVMYLAIAYEGGAPCSGDREILKKVRDALTAAKPKWLSMDYGTNDRLAKGDIAGGANFSGSSFRSRLMNDKITYGYPREGFPIWMDNVMVLKDARNVENAKLFQNFMMDPENAAINSSFTRYANAIKGSEKFMPEDMRAAPEVNPPAELLQKGKFLMTCPAEVQEIYTRIWTELMK